MLAPTRPDASGRCTGHYAVCDRSHEVHTQTSETPGAPYDARTTNRVQPPKYLGSLSGDQQEACAAAFAHQTYRSVVLSKEESSLGLVPLFVPQGWEAARRGDGTRAGVNPISLPSEY